jgi:hypothetical protein
MGESAGGGSIMHQITAYGENGPAPFEQAIIQSPGFFPVVSNHQQEQNFNDYLSLLKVDLIDEARRLSFSDLQKANVQQVEASPYGLYTFGPAIDGNFVPALPGELLLHGQFARNVSVMVGHNEDEVSREFDTIPTPPSIDLHLTGSTFHISVYPKQLSLYRPSPPVGPEHRRISRDIGLHHQHDVSSRVRRQPSPRLHLTSRPSCSADLGNGLLLQYVLPQQSLRKRYSQLLLYSSTGHSWNGYPIHILQWAKSASR